MHQVGKKIQKADFFTNATLWPGDSKSMKSLGVPSELNVWEPKIQDGRLRQGDKYNFLIIQLTDLCNASFLTYLMLRNSIMTLLLTFKDSLT